MNDSKEEVNVVCSPILMPKKRVQRKKIESEIIRLNNLLSYSKMDKEERIYIGTIIDKLQNELGVYK